MGKRGLGWWIAAGLMFPQWEGRAVILMGTSDPARNTTAPAGALAGSGWDLQGEWAGVLGTPIARHFFIAAKHVGGSVGDVFVFRGQPYATVAKFEDPESDLIIWRVAGDLPAFAQLHAGTDEVGKRLVVFGRGGARGDAVEVGGVLGPQPKGWRWTAPDGVMRWGENVVTATGLGGGLPVLGGGAGDNFPVLRVEFNQSGGANEATLSIGDSSGGVFLQDGAEWKLAGVNYATDGPYNTSAAGPGFGAAIFDEGGLYKGGEGRWSLVADVPTEQAANFYATRISSRAAWIQSVLATVVETDPPVLEFSTGLPGEFAVDTQAQADVATRTIRTPRPNEPRYYRLRAAAALHLGAITIEGDTLVLRYD